MLARPSQFNSTVMLLADAVLTTLNSPSMLRMVRSAGEIAPIESSCAINLGDSVKVKLTLKLETI